MVESEEPGRFNVAYPSLETKRPTDIKQTDRRRDGLETEKQQQRSGRRTYVPRSSWMLLCNDSSTVAEIARDPSKFRWGVRTRIAGKLEI